MARASKPLYKSLLWTCALKPECYSRAEKVGAYACIIDLEDSVPLTRKEEARHLALQYLEEQHDYTYGIRINSLRTKEGISDIYALLQTNAKPKIIILPKVESAEEVIIASQLITKKIIDVQFGALIESARGFRAIYEIASVGHNLSFLHGGPADLAADIGTDLDWPGIDYTRSLMILAAASVGISAIDATDFDIHNIEQLKISANKAKKLGFIGKSAIHPSQIPIINQEFEPSTEEIIHAHRIIQGSISSKDSIHVLDGRMIGPPFLKVAQNTLSRKEYERKSKDS